MLKGTLKSGFNYEIPDEVLDDMELFDALADAQKNPLSIGVVLDKLLGEKQKKELYETNRVNGRVSIKGLTNDLVEIMTNNTKN